MRYCNNCQEKKSFSEFYEGLGTCKKCKLEKVREYRAKNPHVARNAAKKWAKTKRSKMLKDDVLFRMTFRIRNLIKNSIRKTGYSKSTKTFEIIGLSNSELLNYLWETFEQRYKISRNDVQLSQLHIDHIIPISTATSCEEVIKLNHFSNLQFLFARDNLIKGARIE